MFPQLPHAASWLATGMIPSAGRGPSKKLPRTPAGRDGLHSPGALASIANVSKEYLIGEHVGGTQAHRPSLVRRAERRQDKVENRRRHLPPAVTQETMLTPGKFGTADVIRNRLAYWICRARRPDRGFHITLNSVFRFERSRRRALSWRARAAPAERSRQRLVDAIGPRSFTRTTTDVPQWLTRSWSRSEESDRRR
jgi:hypothetical protein